MITHLLIGALGLLPQASQQAEANAPGLPLQQTEGKGEPTALDLVRLAGVQADSLPPEDPDLEDDDGRIDTTDPNQSGPQVGSLRVNLHGNGRATVSWNTDLPSAGRLNYGSSPSELQSIDLGGLSKEHSVLLTGLKSNTDYRYSVHATGPKGNLRVLRGQRFNSGGQVTPSTLVQVSGALVQWFPVTLSFNGPSANETDLSPNPFLDYRLSVQVTSPVGEVIEVPGYFDGDGAGGGSGAIWRVRFPTHRPGRWSFAASFVMGPNVAIDNTLSSGTPTSFHGLSGSFDILPTDPNAPGFYKWGKLQYIGEHYLKFLGGPYFIKAGTNSPENFLGYAGFDNTKDMGGRSVSGLTNGLHEYKPHIQDWGLAGLGDASDPLFVSEDTGIDSRGIIGALNYLNYKRINSLFVLPMNLGGDGYETCPYVAYDNTPYAKTHFDISKLGQWGEVLEHAGRRGIMLQFVFGETEIPNERWLDNGTLGVERKLFYREIIARFGHLLAIKWNLCEENDYDTTLLMDFADYIKSLDPYDHTIGFHTFPLPITSDDQQWEDVLGHPSFSTNSMQAFPYLAGPSVEKWRNDSAAAGRKWIVEFDEQTAGLTNDNATFLRKKTLYDVLFSGGHVEWYAGYNPLPLGGDLRLEDFRTRAEMWNYTWHARKFLERFTLFWQMEPMDNLVGGETSAEGGAEVLALPGVQYVIYFPSASATGTLDLRGQSGRFRAIFYDPRTGERAPGRRFLDAGIKAPLPLPPNNASEDWVLYVGR